MDEQTRKAIETMDLTTIRWTPTPQESPGKKPRPLRFQVMRIIDYRILDVSGVGRIWIRWDFQTDRAWAGRYES